MAQRTLYFNRTAEEDYRILQQQYQFHKGCSEIVALALSRLRAANEEKERSKEK